MVSKKTEGQILIVSVNKKGVIPVTVIKTHLMLQSNIPLFFEFGHDDF